MEKNKIEGQNASVAPGLSHPPLKKTEDTQLSSSCFDTCVRFSGNELNELKSVLLAMLQEKRLDHDILKSTLTVQDTASAYQWLEDAAGVSFKLETAKLATRQQQLIERLEYAIRVIENKVCGICLISAHDKLKSGKTVVMNPD